MLYLLVSLALAAEPTAAHPTAADPAAADSTASHSTAASTVAGNATPPSTPATEGAATAAASTPPTEGPGRPVVGIGAGLRGATSAAGFVTSVRLRATPGIVFEPMVYVLTSTTVTTTTWTSGEYTSEQEVRLGESQTYASLVARFRAVEGRRASGWVTVHGSILWQDVEEETTITAPEAEPQKATQTFESVGGNVGAGFGGELWLRPELTLSADAGFHLFEASGSLETAGEDTDEAGIVMDSSGFKLSPYVQLAVHLYL